MAIRTLARGKGHAAKDLAGLAFGQLTVLYMLPDRSPHRKIVWLCRCECGTEKGITSGHLLSGASRSCGCSHSDQWRTHDMSDRSEYNTWLQMRSRCANPKAAAYHRYGGRGIGVCERWRDFSAFLADMGPRPTGTTLDRIDNDGNYEPGNCRWATKKVQVNNTSRNRRIEYGGLCLTVTEWAERIGVTPTALSGRLDNGWTIERALTTGRQVQAKAFGVWVAAPRHDTDS